VPWPRRCAPRAAALAVVLKEFTPEALAIMLEDRLALTYHPDTGGSLDQMIRVNAAYEEAPAILENS
jgi:hypothetical protein